MQSSCAHDAPTLLSRRYAPAASVQSVVLPHDFELPAIVAGWTWCATSTASAAAASTVRYARKPRRTIYLHDCQRASRKLSVHAVVWCASCTPLYCPGALRPLGASCSPLYCPGASRPRQAYSRLTSRFRVASYCRRVDLECDKHGISGVGKHCDENAAQPDASAAATSTANTTMHSPTAFHTASVAATCATLTRSSTRTT